MAVNLEQELKQAQRRIAELETRHDNFLKEFWKTNADNERLRTAICKAKGLIGDVDGTMDAWLVLSAALREDEG